MPVVKIFAFLDLEQISGDFEIEHFETASVIEKINNLISIGYPQAN